MNIEEKSIVIKGYKSFDKSFKNCYGDYFECGKSYFTTKEIGGPFCNGYHFSKNFEETFRFNDFSDGAILTEIEASGKIFNYYDDYYDYDIYSCSNLKIIRVIQKEEILKMILKIALDYYPTRFQKVLTTYPLSKQDVIYLLSDDQHGEDVKRILKRIEQYNSNVKKLVKNINY